MDKPVSKHRKKLNEQQLEVLELLYRFRFGSNDLFAQYFGKKDRSFVYKRLAILLEQGLVGKRFDSSYRLQGKPAAYYLTPDGARRLQKARDDLRVNVKAVYKDKDVSEQFVRYRLELFAIYNQLKAQYGDALAFFTSSDLNNEDFEYFPRPLPDAFVLLKTKGEEKQFFLDVYHADQPNFVAVRRVKQYISYDEDADWSVTETDLPTVLAVCETPSVAKRVQKYMNKSLDEAWSDSEVVYVLTTKAELMGGKRAVWRRADEPDEKLSLLNIS
jgi:hypothetical protein